jgi:hypothetical protein
VAHHAADTGGGAASPMATGLPCPVVMRDLVAFFGDGRCQGLARLAAVHPRGSARGRSHLGLGVELLDGAGDGALAVAAGHAGDLKLVLHVVLRVRWLMGQW